MGYYHKNPPTNKCRGIPSFLKLGIIMLLPYFPKNDCSIPMFHLKLTEKTDKTTSYHRFRYKEEADYLLSFPG